MEIIRKLFVRQWILTGIFFLSGIIFRNKYAIIGLTSGSIFAILGFYLLCLDGKSDLYGGRGGTRVGITRYMKRLVLYGILLFVLLKYFDQIMMFAGAIGILSFKINLVSYVLLSRLKKSLDKINNR